LLRLQGLRKWRKPLVVLTPKGLLRHKEAVSTLEELSQGQFQPVLADPRVTSPQEVRRIVLCSGKVYYELDQFRIDHNRHDVAILRLEMLYPFPRRELQAALKPYRAGTPVYWMQEEPENMGAWRYLRALAGEELFDSYPFSLVARPESASPATGSHSSHEIEQEALLYNALEKTSRKKSKS
jgi:2-oxoglutarate dehydrogenase E1 component